MSLDRIAEGTAVNHSDAMEPAHDCGHIDAIAIGPAPGFDAGLAVERLLEIADAPDRPPAQLRVGVRPARAMAAGSPDV